MIQYKLQLWRGGAFIADLVEADNIKYGYAYNDFKKGSFEYNGNNLVREINENLKKGSEVRIYRKGETDTALKLVYVAEIITSSRKINDKNLKSIAVSLNPLGSAYLGARKITKSYSLVEESAIAADVIQTTQSDITGGYTLAQVDFGITTGLLESTGNIRDRSYVDDNILNLLRQLADVADIGGNPQRYRGFILSPDLLDNSYLRFNWFANIGVVREFMISNNQIDNIEELDTFEDFATEITGNGSFGTTSQVVKAGAAILNTYKKRQKDVSFTNIVTDSELLENTESHLAKLINGRPTYVIKLKDNNYFTGSYRVGDILRVRYVDSEDFINVDSYFRIWDLDITFDNKGRESVTMVISEVKLSTFNLNPLQKLINRSNEAESRLTNLEK